MNCKTNLRRFVIVTCLLVCKSTAKKSSVTIIKASPEEDVRCSQTSDQDDSSHIMSMIDLMIDFAKDHHHMPVDDDHHHVDQDEEISTHFESNHMDDFGVTDDSTSLNDCNVAYDMVNHGTLISDMNHIKENQAQPLKSYNYMYGTTAKLIHNKDTLTEKIRHLSENFKLKVPKLLTTLPPVTIEPSIIGYPTRSASLWNEKSKMDPLDIKVDQHNEIEQQIIHQTESHLKSEISADKI